LDKFIYKIHTASWTCRGTRSGKHGNWNQRWYTGYTLRL
jgi:hypothetical protein